VPAAPVPAAKDVKPPSAQPAGARPNRRAERLVPVAVVLATAGFVVVLVAMMSGPRAGMAPAAPSQPVSSAAAAPPVALEPQVPAPPDGPGTGAIAGDPELEPERKSPMSMRENAVEDSERGTVLFPTRASGHRIFVDGHRAETDGSVPLHLRCGPHVIQIGGHGTPEHIELPCRGAIQLE
jgi:hypothetical protein